MNDKYWVQQVLENSENQVEIQKYKDLDRLVHFLVGQAMRETRGSANPQLLFKIFKEKLDT